MTSIKPIKPPCATLKERIDHGLNEEDQLESGLNINLEAWKEQEETQGSLPASVRQNRWLFHSLQTIKPTEH